MTPGEVTELIAGDEGQRTEFKATFAQTRPAIESLCAFAHAQGGVVFFGVNDDGTICGVNLGRRTLEQFAQELRQNTDPPLAATIERIDLKDGKIVAVEVHQASPNEIVQAYGKFFIRVGRSNHQMSTAEVRARVLGSSKPITPKLEGEIRGPNVFIKIHNSDSQLHRFRVVFHGVSGMADKPRVRNSWLPWNCGDYQTVGPNQTVNIKVAQADGESRDIGKVIRFMHDKESSYDGRLSEYVAFGGELYLDLELQSDAELDIQSRLKWTLEVDGSGTPTGFTPK